MGYSNDVIILRGEVRVMRTRKLRILYSIAALAPILLFSMLALCSPEVSLTLGFDGQVMRHRFAPLLINLSGLSEPMEGTLVVRQTKGVPGSTQAPISHTIAEGVLSNGDYEVTLPIVEPLNPITVELVDSEGSIVAGYAYSARLGIREWPFPLVVGPSVHVDRTEAIVAASELPTDWWAYDAVDSVWLSEPVVSAPILETLGEWVVSGGSLVLFTGSEFPRMDSPVFRKLLPLSTPVLTATPEGPYILQGNLRSHSIPDLQRDGVPILITMPLGAGTISLVTFRPEDLSEDEYARVLEEVKSATRMPSIEQLTLATLRSTSVPRPPYWITAALIALILTGLLLFSETSRHLRSNRTLAGLVIVILSATVSSGLYANRHNAFILLYQANTSIRVLSTFGLDVDLWTLYATQFTEVNLEHPRTSFPIPAQLPTTYGVDFSESADAQYSKFTLKRNERRDLTLLERGRLDVTMRLVADGVEIINRTDSELHAAYVLLSDETYLIPTVRLGTDTYSLVPSFIPGDAMPLMRKLESWYPLRDGVSAWLLLIEQDDQRVFEAEGMYKKVRRMAVTLIEGGS